LLENYNVFLVKSLSVDRSYHQDQIFNANYLPYWCCFHWDKWLSHFLFVGSFVFCIL